MEEEVNFIKEKMQGTAPQAQAKKEEKVESIPEVR